MKPGTYDAREDESDAPDPARLAAGQARPPLRRLSDAARPGARSGAGRARRRGKPKMMRNDEK